MSFREATTALKTHARCCEPNTPFSPALACRKAASTAHLAGVVESLNGTEALRHAQTLYAKMLLPLCPPPFSCFLGRQQQHHSRTLIFPYHCPPLLTFPRSPTPCKASRDEDSSSLLLSTDFLKSSLSSPFLPTAPPATPPSVLLVVVTIQTRFFCFTPLSACWASRASSRPLLRSCVRMYVCEGVRECRALATHGALACDCLSVSCVSVCLSLSAQTLAPIP